MGELLFKHPSEFALILQLINTVDLLVHGQPTNWVKQAESLSRAIVNFEADCRIFGELSRKRPEISRLRLILVALAQYFLNRILNINYYLIIDS